MPSFLQEMFGARSGGSDENSNESSAAEGTETTEKAKKDDIELQENVWETKPTEKAAEQTQPVRQLTQEELETQNSSTLKKHLESLNLTSGIDLNKISEEFGRGETESFQGALATVAENSYKASISQMNKLMDAKLSQVKEEAIKEANAATQSTNAISSMNKELPFTSEPEIAPVATAVLNQYISKGASVPDAIKSTAAYFNAVATKVGGNRMSNEDDFSTHNMNSKTRGEDTQKKYANEHEAWLDILG